MRQHCTRHPVHAERVFGRRFHQSGCTVPKLSQPERPGFRRKDHRHPMVNACHRFIGRSRDNCAGTQSRTFLIRPILPDRCHGEWCAVGSCDEPGVPIAFRRLFPFVKSRCHHKCPPVARRVPEGRFLGNALRARVDQQRPSVWFFVPMRQETPAHRRQLTSPLGP